MRTIEELAREAGDDWDSTLRSDRGFLERFAALVRQQAFNDAYNAVLDMEKGDKAVRFDCCSAINRAAAGATMAPCQPRA